MLCREVIFKVKGPWQTVVVWFHVHAAASHSRSCIFSRKRKKAHFNPHRDLGCISLGKSKSRFLYPKTDLYFLTEIRKWITNLKNPHSEWIHKIKSKSGFLGFMIHAFLWEGICKKYIGLVVFAVKMQVCHL